MNNGFRDRLFPFMQSSDIHVNVFLLTYIKLGEWVIFNVLILLIQGPYIELKFIFLGEMFNTYICYALVMEFGGMSVVLPLSQKDLAYR